MTEKIKKILLEIGKEARKASQQLAMADSKIKDNALALMGRSIIEDKKIIIHENQIDIEKAKENNISNAFLDRLTLNEERIESIAIGLKEISNLNDPVGEQIGRWKRPNGLDIARVRTPLGVIGVIYESRPNVTADAGALCLKAGNAVILRGGSESYNSSKAIHRC